MAELELIAMSGWLSRAKEALSGREARVPLEPIEIACPCGRKIDATRRPTFQRVLCKSCGEPFFLLPIDVYPRPVMKVRKVKPVKTTEPTKTKSSGKSTAVADAVPAEIKADHRPKPAPALAKFRTQVTPLRLIVLSLLIVLGLTGWWQWNRAARSAAEIEFKTATESGNAALQKPDFVEAMQHFSRAATAADVLRRGDPPAEQARQQFRQLTALNSLLTRSLFELIETARATRLRENALAAESEFRTLHAGRWLIVQSEIVPPADSVPVVLEQRIQIFDEPLILTTSLPIFSKVQATSSLPAVNSDVEPAEVSPDAAQTSNVSMLNDLGQREVVFAAQVESLRWDTEKKTWLLTLQSATGFLWTDYDLLLAGGMLPDELHTEARLRAMLAEQSRWIGAFE